MIKITKLSDIHKVPLQYQSHIQKHFNQIAFTYKEDSTTLDIESIGAIFFVSSSKDFEAYEAFGLSSPITEDRFEYIELITNDYYRGLIAINNEKIIEIIGNKNAFASILKGEI